MLRLRVWLAGKRVHGVPKWRLGCMACATRRQKSHNGVRQPCKDRDTTTTTTTSKCRQHDGSSVTGEQETNGKPTHSEAACPARQIVLRGSRHPVPVAPAVPRENGQVRSGYWMSRTQTIATTQATTAARSGNLTGAESGVRKTGRLGCVGHERDTGVEKLLSSTVACGATAR